ncbi:MAG: hypothetical protein CMQ20_03225 [Gammaproteobacteria bacterium]|jgi:hypothetical protein|nr:hypothetical protein [Gammaproteobacteria bacterium]|tara:strand:- start:498 stop:704 length:207 start_codon:yes stop_codon:yes gene_type:complete
MKIFVPMADDVCNEHSELIGHLVPFNPEYLTENRLIKEGSKPRNWISNNDFSAARERLSARHQPAILS